MALSPEGARTLEEERADAWSRYLNLTRRAIDTIEYELLEPWAWAELHAALRTIEKKHAPAALTAASLPETAPGGC